MTKRSKPNDLTVYFNKDLPFDSAILSAVERIREGTPLSNGTGAKRLLALGALVVEGVDARSFIPSMKLSLASERWRLEQRSRGVQPQPPLNTPACGDTQAETSSTTAELKRHKSNEVTVYFNEQEPLDPMMLSAVAKTRDSTSLSKGAGAKRVMALGALTFGDIDARPFIQTMKVGTTNERWQVEQLLRGIPPDSLPSNTRMCSPQSFPPAACGTRQTEPLDRGPAALELSQPIRVGEEISRAGAATQRVAPPTSPAKGLLSSWKGMAMSRSVEALPVE